MSEGDTDTTKMEEALNGGTWSARCQNEEGEEDVELSASSPIDCALDPSYLRASAAELRKRVGTKTLFFVAAKSGKQIYYCPGSSVTIYKAPDHPDLDPSRIKATARAKKTLAAPPPTRALGRRLAGAAPSPSVPPEPQQAEAATGRLALMQTVCFQTPSHHRDIIKVSGREGDARGAKIPEDARLVFVGDQLVSVEEARQPRAKKLFVGDFYARFVNKTAEECARVERAPQRSQEWKQARKYSVTTSQFGAAAGLSPYSSQRDVVIGKLWETFQGNAATRWGTENEPRAAEAYLHWARQDLLSQYVPSHGREAAERVAASLVVEERGLIKYPATPWIGASPDGIARWVDPDGKTRRRLVEYKCPYFLHRTENHPYAKHGDPPLPPQYRAQIQGVMGMFADEDKRIVEDDETRSLREETWDITECDFVVWQPRKCWVSRIPFDEEYWSETLFPKLRKWFATSYLPAAVEQFNGMVNYGCMARRRTQSKLRL